MEDQNATNQQNQSTREPVQGQAPSAPARRNLKKSFCKRNKNKMITGVIMVLLLAGAAAGGYYYNGMNEQGASGSGVVSGSKEAEELPDLVAIVNGDEVKKDEFLKRVQLSEMSYQSQGVDTSSQEARDQIMQNVIDTMTREKVILQYADKGNINVSQDEVNNEYKTLVEQIGGQEKAEETMKNQGLDEKYVKNDIKRQLTIQKYLQKNVDTSGLEVTEQAVQEAYENATVQEGAEKPPLEEVSENIRQQLLNQKTQSKINEYVSSLVENSSVQVMF